MEKRKRAIRILEAVPKGNPMRERGMKTKRLSVPRSRIGFPFKVLGPLPGTIIAALLLMQSTVRAKEPHRSKTSSDRPNVLFITSDGLGHQLSCCGDKVIGTPNLDASAAHDNKRV